MITLRVGEAVPGMTLAELIESRRGDRSLQKLADDAGGGFKLMVWQQWSKPSPGKEPRSFPQPATIVGMAKALGVSQTEVLLAAGRTLGLDVGREGGAHDLIIAGAGDLPEVAKATLTMMAATFRVKADEEGL